MNLHGFRDGFQQVPDEFQQAVRYSYDGFRTGSHRFPHIYIYAAIRTHFGSGFTARFLLALRFADAGRFDNVFRVRERERGM